MLDQLFELGKGDITMMPRPLLFAWQWQLIELSPVLVVTVLGLLPGERLGRCLAGFYASGCATGQNPALQCRVALALSGSIRFWSFSSSTATAHGIPLFSGL